MWVRSSSKIFPLLFSLRRDRSAFSRWRITAVFRAFPSVGLFISQREHCSFIIIWSVNQCEIYSLVCTLWCEVVCTVCFGWSSPLKHTLPVPSLADHPDSNRCTVLKCHSCTKAPDLSPPKLRPQTSSPITHTWRCLSSATSKLK